MNYYDALALTSIAIIVCYTAYRMLVLYLDRTYEK